MTVRKTIDALPKAPADQQLEPGGGQEAFAASGVPNRKGAYGDNLDRNKKKKVPRSRSKPK